MITGYLLLSCCPPHFITHQTDLSKQANAGIHRLPGQRDTPQPEAFLLARNLSKTEQ
jgi:hypothetical protein